MNQEYNGSQEHNGAHGFVPTRWSQVVLAGGDSKSPGAREALEKLCVTYWHPIYSYLRRRNIRPSDAEDLTQQFFLQLMTENALARADQSKGRFRNFLLGALKRFLAQEHRKVKAQKRGGGFEHLRIDLREAEERYLQIPDPHLTPEQVYDRRWAATLLDAAMRRLRKDFEAAEQTDRFEALKTFLAGEACKGEYESAAARLGMAVKSTKMAVYRMRQRYRQLVRAEVADTIAEAAEIDEELAALFG